MDMKALIKKLVLEGKGDAEIAQAVLDADFGNGLSAKDIAVEVAKIKKAEDVKLELELIASAEAEKAAVKLAETNQAKKLDELLNEKLKSIQINPTGSQYGGKITKEWDHSKKDFISVDDSSFSESHKTMNDLLLATLSNDNASATSISKSIDTDNAKYGIKATARSDSNSVGGYAVPTEVEAVINQLTYLQSVVLPLVNTDVIISESKVYPTIGNITISDIADQDTAATESNPTFYNPTIEMKRIGAYTRISNTFMRQKGVNLTDAFNKGYASGRARYFDTRLVIGNITGASQTQDGLVWLGVQETTPVAIGSLTVAHLTGMLENINQEIDWASTGWMMNQKLYNKVGQLEDTGGSPLFREYFSGGTFKPLGYNINRNVRITNVLQVSEDNSTGGTDSVIILCDFSKFIVGIEGGMRIRSTQDEAALKDQTTIVGFERVGWDLLYTNSSASGGVCRVLEITGAGS